MYSPELQSKIASWRHKVANGTLTKEELTEAIKLLREERLAAAESVSKRRTTAKKEVRSADDLLNELEGL